MITQSTIELVIFCVARNIFILASYIEEYYDSVWIFKPRLVSPAVRPAGLVHSLAAFTNWLVARRPLLLPVQRVEFLQ